MALLFADGFEHYGTSTAGRAIMLRGAWSAISGYVPNNNRARTGTFCLNSVGSAIEARLSLQGLKSVVGVGIGLWMEALPSDNSRISITARDISNNSLVSVVPTTDGSLMVKLGGANGTVLAVSDSVITATTFNHIEIKFVIDDIVGSCEVRVNGITVINLTNMNFGVIPVASIALVAPSSANSVQHSWDDLVIWDDNGDFNNDFIGPARVLTLFANGDTAQADWSVVGIADGYDAINDAIPDDDVTYLGTDIVDAKSEFTLPELPTELASISGVFIQTLARCDEAGVSDVRTSMVSNTEILSGADYPLTPSYTYYRSAFDYDPNTNAAWSKEGFEAAKLRIEKTV